MEAIYWSKIQQIQLRKYKERGWSQSITAWPYPIHLRSSRLTWIGSCIHKLKSLSPKRLLITLPSLISIRILDYLKRTLKWDLSAYVTLRSRHCSLKERPIRAWHLYRSARFSAAPMKMTKSLLFSKRSLKRPNCVQICDSNCQVNSKIQWSVSWHRASKIIIPFIRIINQLNPRKR